MIVRIELGQWGEADCALILLVKDKEYLFGVESVGWRFLAYSDLIPKRYDHFKEEAQSLAREMGWGAITRDSFELNNYIVELLIDWYNQNETLIHEFGP